MIRRRAPKYLVAGSRARYLHYAAPALLGLGIVVSLFASGAGSEAAPEDFVDYGGVTTSTIIVSSTTTSTTPSSSTTGSSTSSTASSTSTPSSTPTTAPTTTPSSIAPTSAAPATTALPGAQPATQGPSGPGQGADLARTGSNMGPLMLLGFALILGGVALTLLRARRQLDHGRG